MLLAPDPLTLMLPPVPDSERAPALVTLIDPAFPLAAMAPELFKDEVCMLMLVALMLAPLFIWIPPDPALIASVPLELSVPVPLINR